MKMKKLKPFLNRYIQSPKISYIMNYVEFLQVELALADLKSSVTDLIDLFDEKSSKQIDKHTD